MQADLRGREVEAFLIQAGLQIDDAVGADRQAGAGVRVSKVRVSLNWSRLVMAQGTQQGWGVGFGI